MNDVATVAAGFDRMLGAHGVHAGVRRAASFAGTLIALPPADTTRLYWLARVTLLSSIDDLPAFNAAFRRYFGPTADAETLSMLVPPVSVAPKRERDAPQRATRPPPPSEHPAEPDAAGRAPVAWITASIEERVAHRAFAELDATEREVMLQLMSRVRVATEYRRSRRRQRNRNGDRFDFAATIRAAAGTAGEVVYRRMTRARTRVRPLIFLLDVSGSMEAYARAMLQYARVNARARPRVRAFVFATQLTELTQILRLAGDEQVMTTIGDRVRDYGGGTQIGANLRRFNDRYAQRGIARGGTIVLLSDGWERDDPALVQTQMQRLRRLTRRIIWVNPHKAHPAYEPLARGMAAALPFVDAFVSGHNLRSLEAVAAAIAGVAAERK